MIKFLAGTKLHHTPWADIRESAGGIIFSRYKGCIFKNFGAYLKNLAGKYPFGGLAMGISYGTMVVSHYMASMRREIPLGIEMVRLYRHGIQI